MAERNNEGTVLIIDRSFGLARWIVGAVVIILLGGYARDILVAFAGKDTNAHVAMSFAVNIITKLSASQWFAYMVGAIGGGYGYRAHRLKERNIERMRGQTSELEQLVDQKRTSSGLTPKGKTRKGDK